MNTNTGNTNNNDKSNTNRVRAVAEYRNMIEDRYLVPLSDIFEAYFQCRKNKRNTYNALEFEVDYRHECLKLMHEINDRTYKIGKSICFIVHKPTKREVFAANFRDRVIHHYICLRLEPLFEKYLLPCMKANRKGKGTSDAVNEVFEIISNSPSGKIYKFDLQGFFMSIDKRILWRQLKKFIEMYYDREDKEVLLWLTEMVVMHCPQKHCKRKCSLSEWKGLPANKSLFNQDDYHGLAIGNLTSQMFANFLLKPIIDYLYEHGVTAVVQYVDDFFCLMRDDFNPSKTIPELRAFLLRLGIKLHPNKCYIQHVSKGVKYLGCIISPYRVYTSNRTIDNAYKKIHWMIENEKSPEKFCHCVNSYFGYMRRSSSYKIREDLAMMIKKSRKEFYFSDNYEKVIIKKRYKERTIAKNRIVKRRKLNNTKLCQHRQKHTLPKTVSF